MRLVDSRTVRVAAATLTIAALGGVDVAAQGRTTQAGEPPTLIAGCFRHQLLLSRPYLLQTKSLTPRFGDGRGCRCNNRL